MDEVRTIRPGILVSLKTSLSGNVSYQKVDLEAESIGDGARVKWETTRFTSDLAEHEAAVKARGRAVAIVRGVCSVSDYGLLCPLDKANELDAAISAARQIVSEFNSMARVSQINFNIMRGKIEADDLETMRAINREIRELMESMAKGVKDLNAKAIRDAANKATQLGQMLSPEAKGRVNFAIDKARQAARQIVKAGETAALEIDKTVAAQISEQRAMFLDIDDDSPVASPEAIAFAIDLEPEPESIQQEESI